MPHSWSSTKPWTGMSMNASGMGSFQTFSQHLLLLDDHFCVVRDQFQKLVDIL